MYARMADSASIANIAKLDAYILYGPISGRICLISHTNHLFPGDQRYLDLTERVQILKRVASDDDQIGIFPHFERPQFLVDLVHSGGQNCGAAQGGIGVADDAELNHKLELRRYNVMPYNRTSRVRAENDRDARPGRINQPGVALRVSNGLLAFFDLPFRNTVLVAAFRLHDQRGKRRHDGDFLGE